jgi:hypothetical protein
MNCGIIFQKEAFFTVIAVQTSDLTYYLLHSNHAVLTSGNQMCNAFCSAREPTGHVNLLEDNIETMKRNTETLIDAPKAFGLEVNIEKSKYM